jgi:hypothetical protein
MKIPKGSKKSSIEKDTENNGKKKRDIRRKDTIQKLSYTKPAKFKG